METIILYSLEYIVCIALSSALLLSILLVQYRQYVSLHYLKEHLSLKEAEGLREKCLSNVVNKISATKIARADLVQAEDLVSKYIYNHDVVKQLGEELEELFAQQYESLRISYPSLTSLDLLVLNLLGLDLSNAEICSVLRMERRTLYRRRQLIGQRIGISSNELEHFAHLVLCQ